MRDCIVEMPFKTSYFIVGMPFKTSYQQQWIAGWPINGRARLTDV